jgi:hypothetical protein
MKVVHPYQRFSFLAARVVVGEIVGRCEACVSALEGAGRAAEGKHLGMSVS